MLPQMTPAVLPPRIRAIVDSLEGLGTELGSAAASLISSLVAHDEFVTVDLQTNTVTRAGVTIKVSPCQAVVLHRLAASYPAVVDVETMHRDLYGAKAHEHNPNHVRVMMSALRKRLPPVRVSIQSQHGRGYRLELLPVTSKGN